MNIFDKSKNLPFYDIPDKIRFSGGVKKPSQILLTCVFKNVLFRERSFLKPGYNLESIKKPFDYQRVFVKSVGCY
jgi:hypothetical protein